ncbi:hypothetical protein ASZ90_014705 [hydrocarbon metagenome]|uniref:Uncharacterized protein n=1 Tax=hydrocarbon metagenome TaxID=938273 RepID=A0A0W8F431_9ZZZZ
MTIAPWFPPRLMAYVPGYYTGWSEKRVAPDQDPGISR